MKDNLIQKILDATDGGLNIILSLCPDARKCVDSNTTHFKLRSNEKTPSATLKRDKSGTWFVKDFGGDFSGGAINLYMYLNGVDLKTALKTLGAQYQVLNSAPPEIFLPIREKRPAIETEEEGSYSFVVKPSFSDLELETLFAKSVFQHGSNISKDNKDWNRPLINSCAALGFFALTSFTYIKDREARTTISTDNYPIFLIDGGDFKKIYQPKSLDKKYRFRYFGKKSNDYIFGLQRFNKTFIDGEQEWISKGENGKEDETEKNTKEFKLDNVIICSGDRDSLNVHALGYNVIWLNSESANLPIKVYNDLKKKSKNVYLLPDIDSTGLKQAHQLCLFFLDLKCIQLPSELLQHKDMRGNPCKDVRDYLSYYSKKDFDELVKSAIEYKFWDEEAFFDRKGEWKKNVYVFNNVRAYNFITKCGFYRYKSKTNRNGYEYIHINKNVVKIIESRDIKYFINQFLEKTHTADQQLRNTFYRSTQLKDESLDNLKEIDLDFRYFGPDGQYFFFKNKTLFVEPNQITEFNNNSVTKMVWENKVVQKNVNVLPEPFKIIECQKPDGTKFFDIEIINQDCLFFNYLINASRIHWRKELEDRCDERFNTETERENYRIANKFKIDGELLTPEERFEQKQHLINKLYVLGYILCRHREKSRPWAPFLMDHKLSDQGESNGGSGKTIFARAVETFMEFLLIDGKSKSLTDDKHSFENVTEQTEVILIDDLGRYTNLESFFSMITEGITVNPKYNARFVIEYKDSPKIIFTSNYGVKDITSSAERRLIYAAFCDYYHNNTSGDYREERTPNNDFGKDLFTDFTEDEWNLFINTMLRTLQVYYQIPAKFNPPMDNVLKRNLQGIMGDQFLNWADIYFSEQSGNLNKMISREDAIHDLIKITNDKWMVKRFSQSIEAWCKYYGYVLNPEELKNNAGRIIRKIKVRNQDGSYAKTLKTFKSGEIKEVFVKKAAEILYIKTVDGKLNPEDFKDEEDEKDEAIKSPGLNFDDNKTEEDEPF